MSSSLPPTLSAPMSGAGAVPKSGRRMKKVQQSIREEVDKLARTGASRKTVSTYRTSSAIHLGSGSNSRLVVHWGGRRSKLCNLVTDMAWSPTLSSHLRKQMVTYSSTIQSCMWPALTRLQSAVCVAGKSQGKTMSWVLPLLNSLIDNEMYAGLPLGKGPRAVVLCSGHVSAGKSGDALEKVSEGAALELKIVTTCCSGVKGTGGEESVDFINGCDILVVSPARLVQLMREGLTGLDRCCHLVVEDGEKTLEIHEDDVVNVMKVWRKNRIKQQDKLPDQVVLVGEEWNMAMKNFTVKIIAKRWNPVIVFGSLLEAAVYCQLPVLASFNTDQEEKLSSLLAVLGNRKHQHVVICCTSMEISANLQTFLEKNGVIPMVLQEDMDKVDMTSLLNVWQDSCSVLVVSDDLLVCLSDSCIPGLSDCLVHWDLPLYSKKIFSIRFQFVKNALDHDLKLVHTEQAEVHLLLGEEDQHSFDTLLPLLRRCGADVPRGVLAKVDRGKQGMGNLCERLVEGWKICSPHCVRRHWLEKRLDQGMKMRLEGVIHFIMLRVETPVLYWVRIRNDTLDKVFQKMTLRLGRHFCSEESCVTIPLIELIVGTLVAVEGRDGVYHRARVYSLKYEETKFNDLVATRLSKVEVFLVDEGLADTVHPRMVARLPPSLGLDMFEAGATAVTVTGILPPDRDPDWTSQCAELVAGYLTPQHRLDREEVCRGRVLLHTTSMLWLDRCQMMVKQPTLGRFVLHFETFSWLVSQGWAITNPEHAVHLHQLASQGGLQFSGLEEEVEEDQICSQFFETNCSVAGSDDLAHSKAFLPLHRPILVCMSECVSPGQFYLQLASQLVSLTRLEQEVASWVAGHALTGDRHQPSPGQIVLARMNSEYMRAEVLHVGDMMVVFIVDTGEITSVYVKDTLPCPTSLACKIPHQAIKCSLAGLRPVSKEWTEAAGDLLFDLTRDDLTDTPLNLVCQASQVTSAGYIVRLTITLGTRDVELAHELVTASLASWDVTELGECRDVVDSVEDILESDWDTFNDLPSKMFHMERTLTACSEEQYNEEVSEDHSTPAVCLETKCEVPVTIPSFSPLAPLPVLPPDLPSLAMINNISKYRTVIPRLVWKEDKTGCLNISVQVVTMRDIVPSQVHVIVTRTTLLVQVVEHSTISTLHTLPSSVLKLWGDVVPSLTKVVVKGNMVTIQMKKREDKFWLKLSKDRYDWIRQELVEIDETTNSVIETCSVTDYHRFTGEKVMPELNFEEGEGEEELANIEEEDMAETMY